MGGQHRTVKDTNRMKCLFHWGFADMAEQVRTMFYPFHGEDRGSIPLGRAISLANSAIEGFGRRMATASGKDSQARSRR